MKLNYVPAITSYSLGKTSGSIVIAPVNKGYKIIIKFNLGKINVSNINIKQALMKITTKDIYDGRCIIN